MSMMLVAVPEECVSASGEFVFIPRLKVHRESTLGSFSHLSLRDFLKDLEGNVRHGVASRIIAKVKVEVDDA